MGFTGVSVQKRSGGLVRNTSTSDRVCVLVIGCVARANFLLNHAYKFASKEDRATYGITAATDTTNTEELFQQIGEYFRLSPEMPLWVIPVAKTLTVTTLAANALFIAALKGISGANTIALQGLAGDSAEEDVAAAQGIVNSLAANQILVDVILVEGIGSYFEAAELANYPDLTALGSYQNVGMVIAQDPDASGSLTACMGVALGSLSVRKVHENLGSVDIESKPRIYKDWETYPVSDDEHFSYPADTAGHGMQTVPATTLAALTAKGYIFVASYDNYDGVYFNDSRTCTPAGGDYARIELNAVWNKAARLIRNTLLPRVKSNVLVDADTGYIADTVISSWTALCEDALNDMLSASDVSAYDVYINPSQAAKTESPYTVDLSLVANGIVHEFSVTVGFVNTI